MKTHPQAPPPPPASNPGPSAVQAGSVAPPEPPPGHPTTSIHTADGPLPVQCGFSALVPIHEMKPHPNNPKRHPTEQVELFGRILRHQGVRRPAVVSRRSGFIICGHGMVEALERLGAGHVPVEYQEFATEADEIAHLMADNRLAEFGVTNDAATEALLAQLQAAGVDRALAGIIEQLEEEAQTAPAEDPTKCVYPLQPEFDEGYDAVIIFTKTGQEWAQLQTVLPLPRTMNRKGTMGMTHVIHAKEFFRLLKRPDPAVPEAAVAPGDGAPAPVSRDTRAPDRGGGECVSEDAATATPPVPA